MVEGGNAPCLEADINSVGAFGVGYQLSEQT